MSTSGSHEVQGEEPTGSTDSTDSTDLGAKPDCSEALHRVYEYLDGEMTTEETTRIKAHLEACAPCLEQYDLDQALKALVHRACQCEPAPDALRTQIRARITSVRVTTGTHGTQTTQMTEVTEVTRVRRT